MTLDYNQIQLYQKHTYPSGRVRYIPAEKIYDYELIKPNTTYLVKSLPRGGISTRCIREELSPNYLPILSALRDFEEEALQILHDSNQFKPNKELTKEEQDQGYCIIGIKIDTESPVAEILYDPQLSTPKPADHIHQGIEGTSVDEEIPNIHEVKRQWRNIAFV